MRISDWSSDVCSSDLLADLRLELALGLGLRPARDDDAPAGALSGPPGRRAPDEQAVRALADRAASVPPTCPEIPAPPPLPLSSEERRVGKECGSQCQSRGCPHP